MDSNSWNTFIQDAQQLTKPAQAKQLISKTDIVEIKQLIIDVLKGFLNKEDLHIGLKVYIDHTLRNDMIHEMASNPPSLDSDLEEWSQQIFGDQKFGMVLIGLEQYSNAFAEKAAMIVHPLLESAGLPLHGLSFLFFMGNYGFTPFGIHKEATGEDGVLFHLGPGNKQFYTWDDPKYNVIEHNSEVFHNISDMIDNGETYELAPGDAMFIPHYVYHIANTPEFSVSFVLDYINPPKDQFENELIQETSEEVLITQTEYTKPIPLNASLQQQNAVIDFQSLQKKIEISFARKIKRLKSNGGIRRKSNPVRIQMPPTENFSLKGKKVFPIYLDEQDPKEILLLSRGHRLVIQKHHPMLSQLIDQLNQGNSISIASIRQQMEPQWDLIGVFGFIQELLNIETVVLEDR